MTEPLWRPSSQRVSASHMQRFLSMHAKKLSTDDYPGLFDWSTEEPETFWAALWDYLDIRSVEPYTAVLDDRHAMPSAEWFTGATLNYADNLLKPEFDGIAIVSYTETGRRREKSWNALRHEVASVASQLRELGVGRRDRVAAFLPNCPEAIVAMLATASIGAIWSSCSPDFGIDSVLDRFGQIKPKVLFAADGYFYNGKTIDSRPAIRAIVDRLGQLDALIMVAFSDEDADFANIRNAVDYREISTNEAELEFEPLPFSHPLYILYSSGTTGAPKCIVHGAGASLIQHRKEHALHSDVHAGDMMFYFTTCGWMMWNWLVSGLAGGATLLLYDGSPVHPDPGVLWRIAEREKLALFGTSAKYLSSLEKAGYRPREHAQLDNLKSILSTGSPLAPTSFDFVYRHIKQDLQLSSVSGGTDIIACFGAGNPLLPVYRGEIQCSALGMKTEVFDENGNSVTGKKGELVCTQAFPSMPLEFWNDPDGSRYHAAYFEKYPGIWSQGDYAEMTDNGGIVIYGRSDAALNPGGVRIGTAEIYRIVEQFDEILESIVIGQEWDDDVRIVMFLTLKDGLALDDDLRTAIRSAIRTQTTPRHVPAKILAVPEIPRTINGKIVEIAVRDVVHGREVSNSDALANPGTLEHFRNLVELSV